MPNERGQLATRRLVVGALGYIFTETIEEADVIVLNTCVVRQSAEDKAYGRVTSLAPLKKKNPNLVINLMGCMVGVRGAEKLREKLPFVDVFSPPSDPGPLDLASHAGRNPSLENAETARRFLMMDDELILPVAERGQTHQRACADRLWLFACLHVLHHPIQTRRRTQSSRWRYRGGDPFAGEAGRKGSDACSVRSWTAMARIFPTVPTSRRLLRLIHEVDGIERIRFLTSHPNYFGEDLIDAIAELPQVMPHIEVPIQAGDDEVLVNMKRGYTQQEYRDLVAKIREQIPDCSIATDIIVGFPGETEEQFMQTYRVLSDLKLDVAHLARYSLPRGHRCHPPHGR